MPIDPRLTKEDIEELKAKGIDPEQFVVTGRGDQGQQSGMSSAQAAGATLTGNAGGIIGGGVGVGGAGALLAPWLAGPEAGIPADLMMLVAAGLAGAGGGYVGQKAQQALQSEQTNQAQQQALEEAQRTHPLVSGATDIIASALASGGAPSWSAPLRALGGEREAIKHVLMGAVANPAINAGIQYGTTGELPTAGEVASQAGAGLLFGGGYNPLGRIGQKRVQPQTEQSQEENSNGTPPPPDEEKNDEGFTISAKEIQESLSGINRRLEVDHNSPYYQENEQGFIIGDKEVKEAFSKNNPKPKAPEDAATSTDYYAAKTAWSRSTALPVEEKRAWLHDQWVKRQQTQIEQPQEPLNNIKEGETTTPASEEFDPRGFKPYTGQEIPESLPSTPKEEANTTTEDPTRLVNSEAQPHDDDEGPNRATDSATGGTQQTVGEFKPTDQYMQYLASIRERDMRRNQFVPPTIKEPQLPTDKFPELPPAKPVSANTLRITKDQLLPSSVGRTESIPEINPFDHLAPVYPHSTPEQANEAKNLTTKQTQGSWQDKADEWNSKLENMKSGWNPNQLHAFGIIPHVWDTAISLAQHAIKLTGKVADGVNAFMKHVKYNHIGPAIDEQALRDHITKQLGDQNAIQKSSTSGVLPQSPKETVQAGSQHQGVGQSKQGQKATLQGGTTHNAPPSDQGQVNPVSGKDFGPFRKIAGSVLDNVRALPHKGARALADAMQSALNKQQLLIGKYKNASLDAVQSKGGLSKYEPGVLNRAIDKFMTTGVKPTNLAPKLQKWFDTNKALLHQFGQEHIQAKVPIKNPNGSVRLMQQKENYWPTMANQQTEDIFRQGTDHAKMTALKGDWMDYYTKKLGYTPQEAEDKFNNWKSSAAGSLQQSNLNHQDYFNAIRRAQGDPLPPSFREQDPVKNMSRYFDRALTSLAHYTEVEKNPKAMAAVGATKDAWGNNIPKDPEGSIANNDYVKAALGQYHTEPGGVAEQTEGGVSTLATQMFIQYPGLQAHVLASNAVGAISCAPNPYVAARAVGHALTHMKEGWTRSKENGLFKWSAVNTKDMFDNSMSTYQRMAGVSKAIRDVSTLGGLTTKVNAAFQQVYFEHLIPTIIARANQGDIHAAQQLRHWDSSYKVGKTYGQKETQQLASIAASYIHGTGDIRQMPAWMMQEGEISGFMQLAHWSVSQTNNFMHNFVVPAQRGNYAPLMTAMFGATVGGYMVKELREALQGKKGQIPSLQEISAGEGGLAGHPGLLVYNMIAGMQYAGFGGLFSQVAKYPFDFKYKNSPQGATFPLDEVAHDVLETIKNVSQTIANDPNVNWVDLASAVAMNTFRNNLKLSSVAINQGINLGLITGMPAEKKQLADKLGELRRFEEVQGLPYDETEQGSNPYLNFEQKKFKMTQDMGKAVQMLPGLINNIVEKYKSNPDVMMNKLEALKSGDQYATFPSFEKMPLQAMKYIAYLQREEGPEQAQAALQDYLRHKTINEVKGSLVP